MMPTTEAITRPDGVDDRPRRVPFDRDYAWELGAAALSAGVLAWIPFHLAGLHAPIGFFVCWFTGAAIIYGIVVRQRHGVLVLKDRMATLFVAAGTALALVPLVLVIGFTLKKGLPVVLAKFPNILTHDLHQFGPNDRPSSGKIGMKQAVIGSIEQTLLATLATIPVGVLAATYLNEVGGRFAAVVRTVADAMTGLPSVIAGLFVYAFWIVPRHTSGYSGFAVAMAIGVVMLPITVRTAEEVLRIVPNSLREAGLALGAPEWRMVLRVVLPTARTGLVTASLLGVARGVGETAPVLLTDKINSFVNWNPFRGTQDDLPLRIYTFARQTNSNNFVAAAWGAAVLLLLIVLTLFTLARIGGTGGRKRPSGLIRKRSS